MKGIFVIRLIMRLTQRESKFFFQKISLPITQFTYSDLALASAGSVTCRRTGHGP